MKVAGGESIPLYGDGLNVRDWLYVEDHVDDCFGGLQRSVGPQYCVGGHGERTNKEVVHGICELLDQSRPGSAPHTDLITPVTDRPGHDRATRLTQAASVPSWAGARHNVGAGLGETVNWYLSHQECAAKSASGRDMTAADSNKPSNPSKRVIPSTYFLRLAT